MSEVWKIKYIGVLANCGAEILKLEPREGFQIKKRGYDELMREISQLQKPSTRNEWTLPTIHANRDLSCYTIEKEFEITEEVDSPGHNLNDWYHKIVQLYLHPRLRTLRIIGDGEFKLQYEIYRYSSKGRIGYRQSHPDGIGFPTSFELSPQDIQLVQKVWDNYDQLPDYLIFGIDMVTSSFKASSVAMRFVELMIVLELLFNQGKEQIAHTIARSVALLLCNEEQQFKIQYTRMKKLYDLRSQIVHSGKKDDVQFSDIKELFSVVTATLQISIRLGFDKEKLFWYINSRGIKTKHQ